MPGPHTNTMRNTGHRSVEGQKTVLDDDWAALRATIAGILPECTRAKQMEAHKARRVATYAVKAITELQREVLRATNTRWDEMRAKRQTDDEMYVTEKEICRTIDLVEKTQAKQHIRQAAQDKKARARYKDEQQHEARVQANMRRLDTARHGSRTAHTRQQRQITTDTWHQECTRACEQTHSLHACATCVITALAICDVCTGKDPHVRNGAEHV